MSYYDQMKPVEQDQAITRKAIEQFQKLVQDYPDSRYASDALAKIDICRGRLAQKELWVATYYSTRATRGGPPAPGMVLKDYPRTLVMPEALFSLAEVNSADGREREESSASGGWPTSIPTPSGAAAPPSASAAATR